MAQQAQQLTPIPTRTITIDPRKIKLLDLNAHYMRHETFARLVENLRTDGGFTGNTPFCWHLHDDATQQPITDDDGAPVYEVLSGNHRVKAAITADLPTIEVTVTDVYLPPARRTAIQLSHNAIIGEDDPAILKTIYQSIDAVDLRLYTGLDDKRLDLLPNVAITPLSEASLEFQTITLTFLPHEVEHVERAFDEARKIARTQAYWLASFADYDRALDALEAASQAHAIKNTATALMIILEIFSRHLDELAEGFITPQGTHAHTKRVPLATIFNDHTIPAPLAVKLTKRLKAIDPDPFTALEKLITQAESA